jgi:hypothetical protein
MRNFAQDQWIGMKGTLMWPRDLYLGLRGIDQHYEQEPYGTLSFSLDIEKPKGGNNNTKVHLKNAAVGVLSLCDSRFADFGVIPYMVAYWAIFYDAKIKSCNETEEPGHLCPGSSVSVSW